MPSTQRQIAGMVASTIDYVLQTEGPSGLLLGCVILRNDFSVSFWPSLTPPSGSHQAVVQIAGLDAASPFKTYAAEGCSDPSLFKIFDDLLIREIVREIDIQSTSFSNLPV